ncbi:MAG: membrane-bound lytic murein transglycosylase MltF [SAR324 cluster bacterium]|nr:membrane-bound lytic murein transglycosylase MltF [SAR324 cluster bacterium]
MTCLAAVAVSFFFGCEIPKKPSPPTLLETILQKKKLVVLTHNSSTTYYENQDRFVGFERDLVTDFAKYLGVQAQFLVLDGVSEVLQAMREGKGDIAAAGLTRTEKREKTYLFGPDYYTVQQQVVCRRGAKIPKNLADLPNFQISIIKDSSYEERLKELKLEIPDLNWTLVDDMPTEMLLEKVWEKEIECVVADSNIVAINRRYFPELEIAFPISEEQPLAWIIREGGEGLKKEVEEWLKKYEHDRHLAALQSRYYSYLAIFDYVDIRTFHKRLSTHLPKLLPTFKKAAKKYNIPWTLLASQAYQESHWNRRAKSPTGVRGLMMLTLKTAKQVGVKNRLNASESIMGGAKYFSQLLKRIPENVEGPDRLWYALAAYNVGMGHLYDARTLAKRFGKNPNKWHDLKTILPLLSQRKYYRTLKRGYARGSEPVRYVQRIREFHDILKANVDMFE